MDTETISAFRFRLHRLFTAVIGSCSLVVSALQDAGGYAISRQNNIELHLVPIPVDWVILHW